MNFFANILDVLIPPQCIQCKSLNEVGLCSQCITEIPRHITVCLPQKPQSNYFFKYSSEIISETRTHQYPHLKTVVSITPFRDKNIRQVIHRFKYLNIKSLSYPLSRIVLLNLSHLLQSPEPFILCPVPLHPRRQRFRGYNQSQLLADHLSQDLNIPLYTELIRTRHTQPQMSFPHPEERRKNISQAFTCLTKSPNTPDTVLLVDDVTTTLSTLSEAANALHNAGFKHIYAITIAR